MRYHGGLDETNLMLWMLVHFSINLGKAKFDLGQNKNKKNTLDFGGYFFPHYYLNGPYSS
jgi:hypothetical protein